MASIIFFEKVKLEMPSLFANASYILSDLLCAKERMVINASEKVRRVVFMVVVEVTDVVKVVVVFMVVTVVKVFK
jgi:hypothetical protein